MRPLILLIALLSSSAQADTLIKFGVEPAGTQSVSDVLSVAVGKHISASDHLCGKIEVGYWADKRPGSKDSFYGSATMGVVIKPSIFDLRVYTGVAGISQTDDYLGGHLQIVTEASFAFQQDGWGIGVYAWHMSSAGAFRPNIGRNQIGGQVILPF